MKFLLTLMMVLVLTACGSKEKKIKDQEHEDLKKSYQVTDSSSDLRPGWIEDAELWAKQRNLDTETFRYFSHETVPNVDRAIACSMAKAKVKSDIAGEITTFIEESLAQYKEGGTELDLNNPQLAPMKEFVEQSLAQKTMALIHGAAIDKQYWEERKYQEDMGAAKDFRAFTCAVLVKMNGQDLQKLVKRASDFVVQQATDPEVKAKVEKALEKVDQNFIEARRGQI
jgi:hypothetical protein